MTKQKLIIWNIFFLDCRFSFTHTYRKKIIAVSVKVWNIIYQKISTLFFKYSTMWKIICERSHFDVRLTKRVSKINVDMILSWALFKLFLKWWYIRMKHISITWVHIIYNSLRMHFSFILLLHSKLKEIKMSC